MESMEGMLWGSLTEIEGQLLEDMKKKKAQLLHYQMYEGIHIKVINVF